MAMASFAEAMRKVNAPKLDTLQVAIRIIAPNPMIHGQMHRPDYIATYEARCHPLFRLPSPLPALPGGMTLVRQIEGYLVGYMRRPTTNLETSSDQGKKEYVERAIARVGVYGYTTTGSIATLLEERDIVDHRPMTQYPDDLLEVFGEEADKVGKSPDQIMAWKEMC